MAMLYLKEMWTPLKLIGITLFKCRESGELYYKKRNGRVKKLKKDSSEQT
ncbi:hypothetical protein ACFDTO_18410 [Microbacteriaceae bacterium 4G12]